MTQQNVISGVGCRKDVVNILPNPDSETGAGKCLIVCNYIGEDQKLDSHLAAGGIQFTYFMEFGSNPLYDDAIAGIEKFHAEHCNAIIAMGGGSAIDVAKCIKLFCKMDLSKNCIEQPYTDTEIPLVAVPTTAGTGSESTRYAVIYKDGKKQSITHESIIPNIVILDAELLRTLSLYQKKCTMLDALCQGIESWWSVNSNEESMDYSQMAIEGITRNMDKYLSDPDDMEAAEGIMLAANYAGRAINITQTTAPHAMSYKLTSMYHLPHGHAVAICLPRVWEYMLAHIEDTVDPRGAEYVSGTFNSIAKKLGCASPAESIAMFGNLLRKLGINKPVGTEEDIVMLSSSVNPVRLKNNPVRLDEAAFMSLYKQIVLEEEK